MNRIASTRQLQDELRAIAAYAATPRPSRAVLAEQLQSLAERVAVRFQFNVGDRAKVTLGLGGFRPGEVVRVMGRFIDPAGQAKYIVRGARGDQTQLSGGELKPI